MNNKAILFILFTVVSLAFNLGFADPATYNIDSSHTYPAFEADHQGGLSIWRGKVNQSSGTIVLDKEAETGTIDVLFEMASIDFGHDRMNEMTTTNILHVDEFPTANYQGSLTNFENGAPTSVEGVLTLHGVSHPVNLAINSFKCQPHFMNGREVCGADAEATINRADFGLDYDLDIGFFPEVKLLVTVEAQIAE